MRSEFDKESVMFFAVVHTTVKEGRGERGGKRGEGRGEGGGDKATNH